MLKKTVSASSRSPVLTQTRNRTSLSFFLVVGTDLRAPLKARSQRVCNGLPDPLEYSQLSNRGEECRESEGIAVLVRLPRTRTDTYLLEISGNLEADGKDLLHEKGTHVEPAETTGKYTTRVAIWDEYPGE